MKLDRSKLVKDVLNSYKLTPFIEREIAKGDFDWSFNYERKRGDSGFHPSGDCLPSPLELFLSKTQREPEVISGSLYKTFMVGHFWHQYLQYIVWHNLEFCEESDIECQGLKVWGMNGDGSPKPYHYATGSADIAKCSIPKYGDWLIDFKTMNAIDFRTPGLPARFLHKYIAQVNIYLSFFDLEKALIVKVQKDSPHELAEVEIYRNQALIDAIFQKWELTGFFLAEEMAPPVELTIDLPFGDSLS